MKIAMWIVLIIGSFEYSTLAYADESLPQQWVRKADEIRNPSESFEMTVKVIDSEQTESVLQVFLKGQDKTIIVTKEPLRDRGRNMLMLGRDFQAYVPNLKRSLRLSLSQKLSGQVANGDISRTRWFGDYDVTQEKVAVPTQDMQKNKLANQELQLFLQGKKDNLTYAAIRLWLAAGSFRPLRAEYLGLDGKTVLKRAFFEEYKMMEGALRPTTLRIEDVNKAQSFVKIISMKSKSLDDSFFTIRNMEMLK